MSDSIETVDLNTAQETIARDRREREEACGRALQEVLEQHKCDLIAQPTISDGLIRSTIGIVAR